MSKKMPILIVVIVVLLLIVIVRAFNSGNDIPEPEPKQFMSCSACGARYEIDDDFMVNLKREDMEIGPGGGKIFRCRECGEMAAVPELEIYVDGKKIESSQ